MRASVSMVKNIWLAFKVPLNEILWPSTIPKMWTNNTEEKRKTKTKTKNKRIKYIQRDLTIAKCLCGDSFASECVNFLIGPHKMSDYLLST